MTLTNNSPGRQPLSALVRFVFGLFRFVMKLSLVVGFIAGGLFIGGFLKFSSTVTADPGQQEIKQADALVVLTGGATRIARALELLAAKKARRLLITGVNPDTAKQDISNNNPQHSALFGCCVDIESVAVDTIGNARETKKWLDLHGYKSLILVTSGYHIPRSQLEFQRQMPQVTITPYPVIVNALRTESWWTNSETLRLIMSEYIKYIGSWSRDYLNSRTLMTLRDTLLGG